MPAIGFKERCSDAEFERRHRIVRERAKQEGIDLLLFHGDYQGWANVFYMTNHWDLVACYLVMPVDQDPVLFAGVYPHLEVTRQSCILRDVRFGGPKSVSLVADELRRRKLDRATIGVVEADSYRMPGIPYKDMTRLRELLPLATFVPATALVEEARRRKSPEEIEILRVSAELTDRAFQAVVEAIRPGVTEQDLAGIISGAEGATVAVLVGSTSMAEPRGMPNPSIRPSSREIRTGDIVLIELSKGICGYAGQIHGTVALGPPTELFEEMHRLAEDAYSAITRVLRPGCTAAEVAEAGSIIPKAGFASANPLTHGFGLGIESGLHVGTTDHPAYWPADVTFPLGASLTVEPNPCTRDMQAGATAGGMVIVGEHGAEQLQRLSNEGLIVLRRPVR